ncbi:MAG: response regulator [Leptolyngbyaceae bacterium]|nr:response regulator [Leptolyngbyaceae bacterium]
MYSILVVDDEPANFDVIETFLGQQGYQLHYVDSGEKAIASLDTIKPDLILLDIMMPNMNGMDVCQSIKAMPQGRAIPVIMVTALVSKVVLSQCMKLGADDFISKPINSLELRARVQSMLRIKQQHDDLQSLLKLRQDMVNIVVHDLRTPLGTIFFGLDTLTSFECDRDQRQAILKNMQYAGQRLQALTDEMLLMAKLEDGKFFLEKSPVDITELISLILVGFEGVLDKKALTLIRELPDLGTCIYLDQAMIRRVIENLLANAVKFSPIEATIIIKVFHLESGDLQVTIADQGPGIPPDLRQKIFEKYEIGTPMENVAQVGLGLAFCKMVVEAHGGTIRVEQNDPQGSIFEVTLPKHNDRTHDITDS